MPIVKTKKAMDELKPGQVYVPEWLDVDHFSANQIASISMFQVFFSSLSGVVAYRKQSQNDRSYIHKKLVLYMGASLLIGSLMGGVSSKYLSSESINFVFGFLAILAVILMLNSSSRRTSTNPNR